jgi:hypothetical protein
VLLLTGVLKWKDCLQYPPAWDTLFWFAVLVGMSGNTHAVLSPILWVLQLKWVCTVSAAYLDSQPRSMKGP